MTPDEELAALDAQFNSPKSRMHVSVYTARRNEIVTRRGIEKEPGLPQAAQPAAPAPAQPATEPRSCFAIFKAAFLKQQPAAEDLASARALRKRVHASPNIDDANRLNEARGTKQYSHLISSLAFDRINKSFEGKNSEISMLAALWDVNRRLFEISDAISISAARRKHLEERVNELEARQNEFRYFGVWEAGKMYQEGNFATHAGSLWHANEATESKPGVGNAWTLAVKRGQDGQDAR